MDAWSFSQATSQGDDNTDNIISHWNTKHMVKKENMYETERNQTTFDTKHLSNVCLHLWQIYLVAPSSFAINRARIEEFFFMKWMETQKEKETKETNKMYG